MQIIVPDDELLYVFHRSNSQGGDLLFNRYSSFFKTWIYNIVSENNREIIDDIMIYIQSSIFKFIDNYDKQKGLLYTYLKVCVERNVSNYIIDYNKKNNYSYYYLNEDEDDYVSNLSIDSDTSTYNYIEEDNNKIKDRVEFVLQSGHFNELEKVIFIDRILGKSYKEIATKLNITCKKVDNVILSIKSKYHKYFY